MVLIATAVACQVFGQEKKENFDMRGWGGYEFGQVMKGTSKYYDMNHIWLQRAYCQTTVDGKVRDRGHCLLSFESMFSYSEPLIDNGDVTKKPVNFFYFHEVQGTYDWGDLERPWLSIAFGYFPYKYNPDARNLGEYLYRSGTYPPYILTNFDFPMTRELGAHVTGRWVPSSIIEFEGDVLFTTESNHFPPGDFSLAMLPKVSFFDGIFDIQGGALLSRLFSINPLRTTKHDTRSVYKIDSISAGVDPNTGLPIMRYDSSFFTFSGTKLMGRFSLDPLKAMKRETDATQILWKDDLKLYGETTIIGLKNYPINLAKTYAYDSLIQRMPIMLGINLPTHQFTSNCLIPGILGWGLEPNSKRKIMKGGIFGAAGLVWGAASWLGDRYLGWKSRLDLIAFEWEYFGWKYADDYTKVFDDMLPIPSERMPGVNYSADDLKWSLYMKKDFLDVFSFRLQLARDHMRPICNDTKAENKAAVLISPDHWYWTAKIFYGF